MQLKDLLTVSIMDLLLFDLDQEQFVEYSSEYYNYYIVQVFADEIKNKFRVCVDITKNKY